MNPFRRIANFFRRKPAMIGTPPSQRPMWHDPAAHARDFGERYFVPLDRHTTIRMEELGVPRDRVGPSDHDHGVEWCSFNPHEDTRGVGARGQVNVDCQQSCETEPRRRDATARLMRGILTTATIRCRHGAVCVRRAACQNAQRAKNPREANAPAGATGSEAVETRYPGIAVPEPRPWPADEDNGSARGSFPL
jgi:hypothetical protein